MVQNDLIQFEYLSKTCNEVFVLAHSHSGRSTDSFVVFVQIVLVSFFVSRYGMTLSLRKKCRIIHNTIRTSSGISFV